MKRGFNIIIFAITALVLFLPVAGIGQVPCLTGFVRDENGQPVVDADLDFDNAITGQRVYTPNDNTDVYGFYRVCVIAGRYHVSFAPPPGTHLLGAQKFNLQLSQSMNLDTILASGFVINGSVHDSTGQPVVGIDIDVDSLSGGRVYTPNDNTDSTGAYWIVVPPGTYRIRMTPPPGSRYREIEINPLTINSDSTMNLTMSTGYILSGRVTGNGGAGLDSITIDVRDHLTGIKIFVPNNETDSIGNYQVVLPTGLFDIRFAPPFASRYVGIELDSIFVSSDLSLSQSLSSGFLVNVSVTDSSGNPVVNADLDFSLDSSGQRIFTPFDKTDSAGSTVVALPREVYTVRVDPPAGSILDRLTLRGLAINSDTALQLVMHEVDKISFRARIINEDSIGLEGITLKLKSFLTSPEIPLNQNVSDSLGWFDLDVPVGQFVIFFIPPRGSRDLAIYYENINFGQDTLWNDIILSQGVLLSAEIVDSYNNPVHGAEINFIPDSIGQQIFVANNTTDQLGTADIAVPRWTYTIDVRPPDTAGLQGKSLSGIMIENDTSMIIVLEGGGGPLPHSFRLEQNYPNPFNNMTTFEFNITTRSNVTINIYNMIGQKMRGMDLGQLDPGTHLVEWDGRNEQGSQAASGIYFYELNTDAGSKTKNMILIK